MGINRRKYNCTFAHHFKSLAMIQVHITDDEQMLVELLCPLVNSSGFATVMGTSLNLAQSRNMLAMVRPDVLLLDISLPDGNGIDFCAEMRDLYPKLKILMLTQHDDAPRMLNAFNKGASGYILKNEATKRLQKHEYCLRNSQSYPKAPIPEIRCSLRKGTKGKSLGNS